MDLEPVLLLTSLGTVFLAIILWTLRACIVRYELLIEFLVLLIIWIRVLYAILLIFPDVLQWALLISTFAYMNHFIIRWNQVHLRLLCGADDDATCVHHCIINARCRIKTDTRVPRCCTKIIQPLFIWLAHP